MRRKLIEVANQLADLHERSRADDWRWFGEDVTYANAKMPQAMLLAHRVTGDEWFMMIGLDSLEFLLDLTYRDGRFDFIGNQGWFRRGSKRAVFGQQTIEAGYTTEACLTAYEITGEQRYLDLARAAAEWLLGRNRLWARPYDFSTGACADGLDSHGASMNQGAESVICGLLTLLAVSAQIEKEVEQTDGDVNASARNKVAAGGSARKAAT